MPSFRSLASRRASAFFSFSSAREADLLGGWLLRAIGGSSATVAGRDRRGGRLGRRFRIGCWALLLRLGGPLEYLDGPLQPALEGRLVAAESPNLGVVGQAGLGPLAVGVVKLASEFGPPHQGVDLATGERRRVDGRPGRPTFEIDRGARLVAFPEIERSAEQVERQARLLRGPPLALVGRVSEHRPPRHHPAAPLRSLAESLGDLVGLVADPTAEEGRFEASVIVPGHPGAEGDPVESGFLHVLSPLDLEAESRDLVDQPGPEATRGRRRKRIEGRRTLEDVARVLGLDDRGAKAVLEGVGSRLFLAQSGPGAGRAGAIPAVRSDTSGAGGHGGASSRCLGEDFTNLEDIFLKKAAPQTHFPANLPDEEKGDGDNYVTIPPNSSRRRKCRVGRAVASPTILVKIGGARYRSTHPTFKIREK